MYTNRECYIIFEKLSLNTMVRTNIYYPISEFRVENDNVEIQHMFIHYSGGVQTYTSYM